MNSFTPARWLRQLEGSIIQDWLVVTNDLMDQRAQQSPSLSHALQVAQHNHSRPILVGLNSMLKILPLQDCRYQPRLLVDRSGQTDRPVIVGLSARQQPSIGLMKGGRVFRTVCYTHQTVACMYERLYLGLDAHTRTCTLAAMDARGRLVSNAVFTTSEAALIGHVTGLVARFKSLAEEESSLVGWMADALRPYVDDLVVCDPKHNALISRSGNKGDSADAFKLCRLLRLGELTPVYHADQGHRVDFKIAVQQYLAFRRDHARLKSQIKAKYQQAGVMHATGTAVFSKMHRDSYLDKLPTTARPTIVEHLYEQLDSIGQLRQKARANMVAFGRCYPEIAQFQRVRAPA